MKTKNVEIVTSLFSSIGRSEKEKLIKESPLNDRESEILILRFVNGKSIKESSLCVGMEPEAFVKAQRKAIDKFYSYNFPNNL